MVTQSLGVAGGKLAGAAVGKMQAMATGTLKVTTGARWAQERWGAYRAKREGIRKERVGRFGERISIVQDRVPSFIGMIGRRFRPDYRTTGEREARRRRAEYFEGEVGREDKLRNIDNQSLAQNIAWLGDFRNNKLQAAAAMSLVRTGRVTQLNQNQQDTLGRVWRDTLVQRGTGETAEKFKETLNKTAPEVARRAIYEDFTTDQGRDRFQADVASGKALEILSTLNQNLINNLNSGAGHPHFSEEIGRQYIMTKDMSQIEIALKKLPEEFHDAFLRGINQDTFGGNQRKLWDFVNASGRLDRGFRNASGALEHSDLNVYLNDSRNSKYLTADNIKEETLADADVFQIMAKNQNVGTNVFAEMSKNRQKRDAINRSTNMLVNTKRIVYTDRDDQRVLRKATAGTAGEYVIDHFRGQAARQIFADLYNSGSIKASWLENMQHDTSRVPPSQQSDHQDLIGQMAQTRNTEQVNRLADEKNIPLAQRILRQIYFQAQKDLTSATSAKDKTQIAKNKVFINQMDRNVRLRSLL
jgi:hypothetical protein